LHKDNRAWSDRFIPAIKRRVGPILLTESTFNVDTRQATDLVVIKAQGVMIASRMRRYGYADRYPYEFTVRSRLGSGRETELSKMLNGYADWMFYGHANQDETDIGLWMLIDLNVWRGELLRRGYQQNGWSDLAKQKDCGDGTVFFAFDIRKFPEKMLIAGNVMRQQLHAA
jgi:hypothetical protein